MSFVLERSALQALITPVGLFHRLSPIRPDHNPGPAPHHWPGSRAPEPILAPANKMSLITGPRPHGVYCSPVTDQCSDNSQQLGPDNTRCVGNITPHSARSHTGAGSHWSQGPQPWPLIGRVRGLRSVTWWQVPGAHHDPLLASVFMTQASQRVWGEFAFLKQIPAAPSGWPPLSGLIRSDLCRAQCLSNMLVFNYHVLFVGKVRTTTPSLMLHCYCTKKYFPFNVDKTSCSLLIKLNSSCRA